MVATAPAPPAPNIEDFEEFCQELPLENGEPMVLYPEERVMLRDYFEGVLETLILISKKNGKSSLLAALGLHRLERDPFTNCAIAAASRDQAMVLFDQMRGFVLRSPKLQREFFVMRGYREIRRGPNSRNFTGLVKVFAADADTADGWLGDLAMIDELHRQKSSDLYGIFRDGLGPRDGQMITISTAGDHEDSPLGELRQKAYAMPGLVRDGAYRYARSGGFAMHEWALDPSEFAAMAWPPGPKDLALVKTANPAPWQTVEKLAERASSPSMTKEQWARFASGVWGLGTTPAFDVEVWESLERHDDIAEGRKVTLGFDGARRQDTTALVAVDIESGHIVPVGFWPRPADADEDWETPENEVDEAIEHAFERWDVWRLYGDPPFWESALDRWAGHYGKDRVVRWWTNRLKAMAVALRAFKNDMDPERMSHNGDPVLTDHIANSVAYETRMRDGEDWLWVIRKDSRKSPRKIDLAMATVLAWKARGDAIQAGVLDEPDHRRGQW